MSKPSNASSGIGFFGALFLVFLVLKLTNVIAWNWWWVFAPLWMPVAAFLAILAVIVAVGVAREISKD